MDHEALKLIEVIDQLAAYDDDTTLEELRGNLDAIRAKCAEVLARQGEP